MWQLNLPEYKFRVKIQDSKEFIFDNLRKKFVVLTPEEWVRQHFIRFLIEEKKYPASFIAVEKQIELNGLRKRCDAVVYNPNFEPMAIIELKAPQIQLTQSTFDQAAVYNSKLKVDYLLISNGLNHYACKVDTVNSRYAFFEQIPDFNSLL
jgi:type I site-specific restriction endonuclease